jgi:hypothetical protein
VARRQWPVVSGREQQLDDSFLLPFAFCLLPFAFIWWLFSILRIRPKRTHQSF